MGQTDRDGQEQLKRGPGSPVLESVDLCVGPLREYAILPGDVPPTERKAKLGLDMTHSVCFLTSCGLPCMYA